MKKHINTKFLIAILIFLSIFTILFRMNGSSFESFFISLIIAASPIIAYTIINISKIKPLLKILFYMYCASLALIFIYITV